MNSTSPEQQASLQSPLPDKWVGRIFDELQAMYGSKFADMWAGTEPGAIRATWARKLGGFTDRPECLKSALNACDDRPWPPSLPEFLGLCRDAAKRAGTQHPALPEPHMSRDEAAERLKEVTAAAPKPEPYDWLRWAKEFRTQYLAGERLLPIQIALASEALGEIWPLGGGEITERLA